MSRLLSLIFIAGLLFPAFENIEKSHSLNIIQSNRNFEKFLYSAKTTLPFIQNYLIVNQVAVQKKWISNQINLQIALCGDQLYKETFGELGFIKSFYNFQIGGSVSLFNVDIKNYESLKQFSINFLSTHKISKKFNTELHLRNISTFYSNEFKNDIPQILKLSFDYTPSPKHKLNYLIEKDTLFPVKQTIFYSVEVIKNINLLSGYCGEPSEIYFGLTTLINNLEFSSINFIHPVLGLTYSISFSYAK